MTAHTHTGGNDSTPQAQAIVICEPRMVSGVISYELVHQNTVVGEIRQGFQGSHVVLLDLNLHTSANSKQVFSGTFQECTNYILTGGQLSSDSGHNSTTEEKQMTVQVAKTFTHPNLTHLNGVVFPELPEHLQEFNKSEAELQAMSYQDLDDATDILQDMEFSGLDHRTSPWIKMYAAYRNSSQLNGRKSWNEVNPPVVKKPVVEEKQMSTQVATITPEVQAANDYRFLELSKKFFKTYGLKHPDTVPMLKKALKEKCEELSLALAMHDQEPSNEAMAMMQETLGRNVKGLWKVVQQFKNSQPYLDLVAEFEPTLEVTGGNQMGTVVSVGKTAKDILSTVTDTPEDSLKAHGLTKASKPAKGTKAAKAPKAKKEKVAKTPKVKEVKVLPLPTIESIADLESFSRQSLQYTVKALKSHDVPINVKGNHASDVIKIALAKHYLGIENYVPAPKPEKVKGVKHSLRLTMLKSDGTQSTLTIQESGWMAEIIDGVGDFQGTVQALIQMGGTYEQKDITGKVVRKLELVTSTAKASKGKSAKAPEAPLPMPEAITWQEVLGMSYKQLQGFCKVLRSNGLFEGNVGGKGSGKDILLSKAADAMRQLGHEIIEANIIPVNPDEAKPILERHGVKYDLMCQASVLLAA